MKRNVFFLLGLVSVALLTCGVAYGQSIMVEPDGKFEKKTLSLPYAFYNENFGFAAASRLL